MIGHPIGPFRDGSLRSAAIQCAAALLLAVTVGGCIGGERLYGPTITVRNDSRIPVVVRLEKSKWEVAAGESRFLAILPVHYIGKDAPFEVLDAETCGLIEIAPVSFKSELDPLLIIPVLGAPTTRALTTDDREGLGPDASMDPNHCIGVADGLNVSVESHASEPYYLVARDDSGEFFGGMVEVPAGGSGALAWDGVWAWSSVMEGAGEIILLDASCQPLSTVEHQEWGSFMVAIDEGGEMTIGEGPLPTERPLPNAEIQCPEVSTPLPSPTASGN